MAAGTAPRPSPVSGAPRSAVNRGRERYTAPMPALQRIVGIVDFALIGVFARLTAPLAAADVSVFLISTYDTDLILVRERDRARAIEALCGVADAR